MQMQYSIYSIVYDLYFQEFKFAIETDIATKNIEHLVASLLETIPKKKTINEIFRYIKKTSNKVTKKSLIDKISLRLLKLIWVSIR